jgi:hypothetical protein
MTDIILNIDTSTIPASDKRSSSDFTIVMSNPIRLEELSYNLVLLKLNTFYSLYNLNLIKYQNTEFDVSEDPGGSNPVINLTITIPDGIYSFEDFVEEFERQQALGGFSGTPITFTVNRNTGKFTMVVAPTCQITMSITSSVMFGFYDKTQVVAYADNGKWWSAVDNFMTYLENSTTISTFTPEWSMGVVSMNLECDITSNSISNGRSRAVVANFSPRTAPFGSLEYEPINPTYMQINSRNIQRINFRITDQSGNVLELHDEVSILMAIRPFYMAT